MSNPRGRREAWCLLAAALLTAAVFASGALDIAAARWFFRPNTVDHWPLARESHWRMLYAAAPWITAVLISAGLGTLALSLTPGRRHWRGAATLVLLAVAIGPGLIGNVVLKDHWQHPRPRDLVELGGSMHYVASPLIGKEGGASFPCGHCTVGFLFGLGWWIFRRPRPRWARASLMAGLATGALLGMGRMAAGAHFLSDVIWSALIAYGVTHVLYYQVLHLEGAAQHPRWPPALTVAAALAGVMVLLALSALPHGADLTASEPLSSGAPRVLEIEAGRADITVVLIDAPLQRVTVEGELHGFGLPGARLGAHFETVMEPAPVLRYSIDARGRLTDVDGLARLEVPARAFERIRVHVGRGNVQVVDATQAGVVRAGTVQLDLSTGRGMVRSPTN